MPVQALYGLSVLTSFVAFGIVAKLYIAPRLKARPREDALRCLIAPHMFRFVGLSFLVPGVVSPASFAAPAAYGDRIAAVLAIVAILALTAGVAWAAALVWLSTFGGAGDLLYAFYRGLIRRWSRSAFPMSVRPGLTHDVRYQMRKIIEATRVTLDGVFEAPNVWATEYFDEEAEASALARLMQADGMLMGRGVYEFFLAAFPHQTGDYAARINSMRKYVVSNTLEEARWNNSTVIRGDLVAQISSLKEEAERDLVMYGHGRLGAALLRLGLLDELNLFIHPVFMGHGKLLFREGEEARLKLVWTRALKTGVIAASYQPVRS